ncbi:MAG TPA: secretin N-terminal domain-containing protein [Pyrinomonadaceae bacterium]|jgi:general secretion pathway protein D|nr:secretin N-terminal domain-containing protein [Pyrinomonadaceae bacterium]
MKIKSQTRVSVSLLLTFCLLILPATAFAKKGDKYYKEGLRNEQNQQWEKAAQEFTLALAADPSNWEYQLHFRRASFNASQSYMQQGRSLAEQRDFVGAYNAFRQAYGYDAVNELAVSEMERMLRLQGVKEGTSTGTDNGPKNTDTGTANPTPPEPVLPPARTEQLRVISYSGDLKAFIRSLAEQLNLNVIFDRQSFVQPRTIDINLRDVTTSQALDYIFLQESMFFQKLSRRTILVADQTRRPQYQQLVLRTFFLANSDPEKTKTLVGQAIPPSVGRPQTIVVADKDTNSLTIRDTAENVRLIGELIQSIDKDRAEVVMDVNIYEVSRTDLMQFGSQWGSDATLVNLGGIQKGWSLLSGGATTVGLPVSFGTALMIPSSALAALQGKNRGKLVASTQVHAFNGEESTARIGQRVPVQTAQAYPFGVQTGTGTTNNGFPTGGFPVINYEPTGLTLKFTPQVFPNQDVQVKMSIESKDVLGANTLTPTFTERTITGTARVQNNRTMMLASVSTASHNEDRKGLPVLSGLPILGRFFSAPTSENRNIDIVIAVTPRVLRAPAVTPRDEEMRPSGTLQSPTTGSLEAMLREADREDQLAEFRQQQKNPTAQMTPPPSAPGVFKSNAPVVATTQANAPGATDATAVNAAAGQQPNTAAANQSLGAVTQPAAQEIAKTQAPAEELPAFVPAPKSLVSNTGATEVAAINTGINTNARATMTSLTKPIETALGPINSRGSSAQLSFTPADQTMKVRESRRYALELKSDVSLAMAIVALRFDPKVVKVTAVSAADASGAAPSFTQSIDASGVCLISFSNLKSTASTTLVFIDVEGIAPGDAGLLLDKDSMHLVGVDARDVLVDVAPVRATVKQ